jgi:hypothetical protein
VLIRTVLALAIFFLSLCGCIKEEPVPPEVKLAETQEFNLWRAGAPLYLQEPFSRYRDALDKAKDSLIQVNSRFSWFRDYQPVQAEFVQVLKQGDELFTLLEIEKQNRAVRVRKQMTDLRERLRHLDQCSRMTNEDRASRSSLTRAEVTLNEARTLYDGQQYRNSEEKLKDVETHLSTAEKLITPVLSRYKDKGLIRKWKKWAEETIEESADREIYSVVVIKAERKLCLYQNGRLLKTYPVGLGRSGWSDKQRAKDNATPEGKYRIIGKNPRSPYHRALLINYPNEEDREEFHRAKKRGLLPETARIGGSIEIHGGGSKGMTYGCLSLANNDIEELYTIVEAGTPIAIVGALDHQNSLSSALTELQNGRGKKKTP